MPDKPPMHKPRSVLAKKKRVSDYKDSNQAVAIRNTNKWKEYSKKLRKEYPVCQNKGCHKLTTSTHHIKPLESFPDLAFVFDNTIPMCWGCHRRFDHMGDEGIEIIQAFWPPEEDETTN